MAKDSKPAKTKKTAKSVSPLVNDETLILTKEGLLALQTELEDLKTRGRKEVADRLKEAISYGDLSENSEYEEAKNQQAFIEGRIIDLESKIRTAQVVDEKQHSRQEVEVGSRVKVKSLESNEEMELMIVGSTESDPFNNKISNEAPIGVALMGSKVGDKVTVEAPHGNFEYKVLSLS